MLTPLAVDPAHPFPYISGLSLNLAVVIRNPKSGKEHFARVKVPPDLRSLRAAGRRSLRAARGRHRRAPQAALPRHGDRRGAHVPGHPQRGPRGRGGRRREPAGRAREGAAAPEVRAARTPRGRGLDERLRPAPARLRARRERRGGVPAPRSARPARAARDRRPDPRGPQVPRVRPDDPHAAGRGRVRRAGRRLQGDPAPRRAAAPPLRLVRDLGAALHRAGRRRPARPGDQADALPDLGRLPDHRRPHRRRRGRQAGAGAGRDQGTVRRGGQHPLGPQARAGRLPRRLRAGRPQDALQAGDGRARRARRDPALHPHRHRQLQLQDRPDVRGPRPDHHRRGDRRGRRSPLQQPVAAGRATPTTSSFSSPPTTSAAA